VFPNIQVIASTHSPLIVAGLKVSEITRLERGRDGKIGALPIDEDMTMGRTDQILVTGLFGLPNALPAETTDKIKRYKVLLGKDGLDAKETVEFDELETRIKVLIPPTPTDLTERRARELLHAVMSANLDAKTEPHKEVLSRAAVLARSLDGGDAS
jgi:hypothetical protein